MTTEEKLENFYNHSMESAHAEAERMIAEHQTALDQIFSEHQETKKRQAEAELAAEKEKLKRENNKVLSTEQLQIKRTHSLKNMELKNQLFAEVEKKLLAFKETPAYKDYLSEKIEKALKFAQGQKLEFFLDSSDSALLEELAAQTGASLHISAEHIIGGVRAVIPEKHILIDNSFAAVMGEERESFIFEGGRAHE